MMFVARNGILGYPTPTPTPTDVRSSFDAASLGSRRREGCCHREYFGNHRYE